ncbi:lipase [Gilbertella persicaria]|uniref:lipase n=1 Tax=Gilbertella persicaria TaxID=101096 RepID=UPI00222097E1|nr:lipase [Gilbertella persicaria]KAI8090274.1 lipase [Gilbertella persicaria]
MVSFTSISQGANLLLAVSCLFLTASNAAPTSPAHTKSHVNITSVETKADLPPLINSRTKPAKVPSVDFNSESKFAAKNVEWYNKHGGNYNFTKRDDEQVGGMLMDLPKDGVPGYQKTTNSNGVVQASASQVNEFTKYAAIASTAYCRSVVPLTKWDCKQCLKYVPDGKLIKTFSSLISDTNGFILRSDAEKTIYLVFRGTNSIRSAIADLKFDFVNYPNVKGAKVHRGFLQSYNEVVAAYFPVIQDQLTAFPNYKIIVTGHSLGGAQALLAGMDLYQRDSRFSPKNLHIFTAGCPRVGNPDFAYYVDSTSIPFSRSVNERDIVPHVPPQAFGYLHPGVEAWTKSSGNVQICTDNIETDSCSNTIVPFTSITDHLTYYGINEGLCL